MRLKSYFAGSVQDAIDKARTELGPEAMLLNSKKIAPEQRHLGAYEVVFGITDEPLLRKPAAVLSTLEEPSIQSAPSKAVPRGRKKTKPFVAPLAEAASVASVAPHIAKPMDAPVSSQPNAVAEELAELRKQIEGVKHSLSSAVLAQGRNAGPRTSSELTEV